jgi:hypothetical protein
MNPAKRGRSKSLPRSPWSGLRDAELRRARVLELWAMGYSYAEIAEAVDLTTSRVGQIIREVR